MIVDIDFELWRILLAGAMLGVAAFLDLRKREISDLLWIVFGISAVALYAAEFALQETFDPLTMAVSIMMAAAVSFGIYKSGLFGGADALALIILAIVLPSFAGGISERISASSSAYLPHTMAPLIVLSNSMILSTSMIGFDLVSNALCISRNPGKLFKGLERESVPKKSWRLQSAIAHKTSRVMFFPLNNSRKGGDSSPLP